MSFRFIQLKDDIPTYNHVACVYVCKWCSEHFVSILNFHNSCFLNNSLIFKMSDYFLKLQNENPLAADRYKEKLVALDGVDPFSLDEKRFSQDPANFPPVCNMDIVAYLVLTTSYYSQTQMKAFKSLNAFKFFEAGFVSACGMLKFGSNIVIIAKVKHSQRMNLPPLSVWVIFKEDGSVTTAHCTCVAGLGGACSHVGAVLFAMESVNQPKQSTSCTDVLAQWNVPKVSKVECKPVQEMDFGRVILPPRMTENVPKMTDLEIEASLQQIEDYGGSAVAMRVFEPFASRLSKSSETRAVINPFSSLYNESYKSLTLEELIEVGLNITVTISDEDCELVRQTTKEQALSSDWFKNRAGRITASVFKKTTKTSISNPSLSLIKTICYPLRVSFKSAATEWGKTHEKIAIEAYCKDQAADHEGFMLMPTGLCIDPQYPVFAATPDSLVKCDCCGKGVVEVKCPYLLKEISIDEYAKRPQICLKDNNEIISLDYSHDYYYQMQQQMAVTKRTFGDFVIWGPKELFIERVFFNEDFWLCESGKSAVFHEKVIMPELLAKFFTKNIPLQT